MKKWFETLLLDVMVMVMIGFFGWSVMDWLHEDPEDWVEIDIVLN